MDEIVINTAHNILHQPALAEQLAGSGYTIFPFLGAKETGQLVEYYSAFQKEVPAHFYSSSHAKDPASRKKASAFIKEIIGPLMPTVFKHYRLLGGAFVVKPPHGKGILQPHQDWNIVDETKTRSFNLWIPLTDVTVENGAVFVLPGSHAKIPTYRGPGIPSLFKNTEAQAWEILQPLPMQAGEALFYDHALLHGSPVNTTDKMRLGIVCGVIATGADMQLCFAKDNGVNIYKANEQFFMEKDPTQGPQGLTFLKEVYPQYTLLEPEDFQIIYADKKPKSRSWFERLFG